MGGEVPRSYYLAHEKLTPKKNMKPILIAPGAKTSMEFEVKQPDSTLKYKPNKLNNVMYSNNAYD